MKPDTPRAKALLAFAVLIAFIGLSGGIFGAFYYAMPQYKGEASLHGLTAPVKVIRDEHGVPHIFANDMNDAARALGYVHAGERLFQMELQRRAGQGTLSEVFGSDMLGVDKYIRTLGLYALAQSSFTALSPEAQTFNQAYADGVNAWLETHRKQLPPEFLILGIRPDAWQPADSVVWGKLMALQLSKNYGYEILRSQLAKKLSADQMKVLFTIPTDTPITTEPSSKTSAQDQSLQNAPPFNIAANLSSNAPSPTITTQNQLGSLIGLDHPASNEWVISGSRTESGKPILANDPHLGLEAPILWYLARIVTPTLSIKGATVPGLPIVLLGQNDHIAWGFTTTGSDTQDLFIETIDPKNPNNYMTPDGSVPFDARIETIHVKGATDVKLTVRTTHHGPVMSDIDEEMASLAGKDKVMALAFTALGAHDTTAEALMRLNRAGNWQEFQDALKLYQAPTQNVVYADTDGHIGFMSPGYLPIRKQGDGTIPVDGASGENEWVRLVPFDELPQVFDPPAGFIFNGNNAIVSKKYPYFIGMDWEEPYRARRLQQYFDQPGKHTLDTSAMMQADVTSLAARQLLPYLLQAQPMGKGPLPDRVAEALILMQGWNSAMDKNRPEPLIFEAWLYEMHKLMLQEKAGNPLEEKGPYDATAINAIMMADASGKSTAPWCGVQECKTLTSKALNDAIDLLTTRDGPDIRNWRWGNEHITHLRHKFYSHIPGLSWFSKLDIPSSGDFYTLDRGGSFKPDTDAPFMRDHGGGFRGLYDLGDPSQSRFMITTGESGHIFSRHYGDLVKDWNDVKSFTLSGTHDELAAKGLPELTLKP